MMAARSTRLIKPATARPIDTNTGTIRMVSGSGNNRAAMPGPPLIEREEAPMGTDADDAKAHDAWAEEIRRKEMAAGIPAMTRPVVEEAWTPPNPTPPMSPEDFYSVRGGLPPLQRREMDDLNGLPDQFSLLIERKADGVWKVTAPDVHVGLFVADADLGNALSNAPAILARIVRLDGIVAKPAARKRKTPPHA